MRSAGKSSSATWRPPERLKIDRGYARLYSEEVSQAEYGCDFDFLRKVPRKSRRRD